MIIDLSKIPNLGLEINNSVDISDNIYKSANIIDLKNVHIEGTINYDYDNNLIFNLQCTGIFILQDAINLEPIEYPFTCAITDEITNISEYCGDFYEKSKNTLDISEILWENIVLEIPISATNASSDDLSHSGNGWELAGENKQKIDPRLAKLNELLDNREE